MLNPAAQRLYGYTCGEFLQLTHSAITAEPEAAEELIHVGFGGRDPYLPESPPEEGRYCFSGRNYRLLVTLAGAPGDLWGDWDNSERVAYEKELHKNREELRSLASELSVAEQRERERIGRELHDGISQLLNSVYIRLNVLKDSQLP